MSPYKLLTLSVCLSVATLAGLMYWYQWSGRALTQPEVETYISTIGAQTQSPGGQHDMQALRAFLEEDDGKPVYTVNLYTFHEQANYPAGSGFSGSGEAAYDRFSKVMISLMTRRGSHPVYGSNWADTASSRWDRIVIVRYRSRRDLADVFATNAFADASLHKWASLREHDRMIVQATHIPDGRYLFLLVAFTVGVGAFGAGRVFGV